MCAQNMLSILSSIIINVVNIVGGGDLYDHLMSTGTFHFDYE